MTVDDLVKDKTVLPEGQKAAIQLSNQVQSLHTYISIKTSSSTLTNIAPITKMCCSQAMNGKNINKILECDNREVYCMALCKMKSK